MIIADQPSLAHLVRERARLMPDRPALTIDGGANGAHDRCTYGQLWARSLRLAAGLRARGLNEGDALALVMANHREFVECMVAAGILGLVFVPVDPRTKAERLAPMLRRGGCAAAVAGDYALPLLNEARRHLPELRWVAVVRDDGTTAQDATAYDDLLAYPTDPDAAATIAASQRHPMQLIFTSGTTGDSKGILMTHERFAGTAVAAARGFGYGDADRLYSGLSLTHANAQLVTLGAGVACGIEVVLSRRFSKSQLWHAVRRHGCTSFTLLGGMTTAVYAEPPHADDADNPVRFVVSAGMPRAIWRDFEARFGLRVLEFWGTAEGGLSVNPIGAGPVGSIGKPAPSFAYRIVDEDDQPVAQGTPGELQLRHADGRPFVVDYHRDPEASMRKCRDGWLRTGDVVHEDAQGWLFFHHRIGSGLRRNGEFIDPAVIEKALAESGLVRDVYVYGRPCADGTPGEKEVIAAVVPLPGAFGIDSLRRCVLTALEPAIRPDLLQIVDEIPKTASEKPQDRFLLERLDRSAVPLRDAA